MIQDPGEGDRTNSDSVPRRKSICEGRAVAWMMGSSSRAASGAQIAVNQSFPADPKMIRQAQISHKIAQLSLDFAGQESVCGGERTRRRWTAHTAEITIEVYFKQMRERLERAVSIARAAE